jgi:acyl dehydratase
VRTCLEDTDNCLFTTIWTILVRGEGGFGGEAGEKRRLPEIGPKDRPIFHQEFVVPAHQALLYRLNGDRNPLHADPDFAKMANFPKPILHGLCTYGYTGRAVLAHLSDDVSRFNSLWSRFTAPVFPGDTLIVEGFELDEGKIFVRTLNGADVQVLVGEAQISG